MSESTDNQVRDREYEEFNKLCGPIVDPILLILRVHLYTEYLMERIIMAKINRGDRLLETGAFSYSQKLSLVHSFDYLPDKIITSLKNLNRVRNRFSHELHKDVSISDIDSIGRPQGGLYTQLRNEHHDNLFILLRNILTGITAALAAFTHITEEETIPKKSKEEIAE